MRIAFDSRNVGRAIAFFTLFLLWPPTSRTELPMWRLTLAPNFGVVEEGRIYRSGKPDVHALERILREHHIKTLLVLNQGSYSAEERLAHNLGVRFIYMPMHIRNVSYTDAERAVDLIGDPRNQPVLVHCSEGIERTGFVVALYRLEKEKWALSDVFVEMMSYNFRPSRNPKMVQFLLYETREITQGKEHPSSLHADEEKKEERLWRLCRGRMYHCPEPSVPAWSIGTFPPTA